MNTDELFTWYEANLSSRERKKRGHFSTPPLLVDQILDACGYRPDKDLAHLRVLDPACGSGNFLAGAARRLVAFAQHNSLDTASLFATAQRNLWGFDPDPVACFLAEMQVRIVLGSFEPGKQHQQRPLSSLHIHQADGLALPWHQYENVDLLLANPPYLASKNSDLGGYGLMSQHGQIDSYLLFLRLALQVVRPGGWICLVLPDPILARKNAAIERRRLLNETALHHLWHFARVFDAHVGAVVIVAQKTPPPRLHRITWVREHWPRYHPSQRDRRTIAQDLLAQQPRAELRYLLGEAQHAMIACLSERVLGQRRDGAASRFVPLSQLVEIRRGEELGKSTRLLYEQPATAQQQVWYPVLRGGGDVRPYCSPAGNYWIERGKIAKPLQRYLVPKLLVVKSTGRLQAALDLNSHVVLQTLYLLKPHKIVDTQDMLEDLYYLLALLNSRLLQEYVRVLYTAYKWVQPQIEQHVLAQLPVPIVDVEVRGQLARRAQAIMSACSTVPSVVELEVYEEQERAIQALYRTTLQEHTL